MKRNLKMLGLALVAVLAMSSVAASMASADEFTAHAYPVTLTGAQEGTDLFTTEVGTVSCKSAKYVGTAAGPTTAVTVAPTYSECTGLGFPAEVHMNGCTYTLKIGAATTGTVDINCPAGQEITVTSRTALPAGTLKCTIHVPPQAGKGTITYTNVGTPTSTAEITLTINLANNLNYSATGPLAGATGLGACPDKLNKTNGSYHGKAIVTGEEDKALNPAHIGLFLS